MCSAIRRSHLLSHISIATEEIGLRRPSCNNDEYCSIYLGNQPTGKCAAGAEPTTRDKPTRGAKTTTILASEKITRLKYNDGGHHGVDKPMAIVCRSEFQVDHVSVPNLAAHLGKFAGQGLGLQGYSLLSSWFRRYSKLTDDTILCN